MPSIDFRALYAEHLQVLSQRATRALMRAGFDYLVIPSGTVHHQIFDDRHYPFAVNPHFKAWVPVVDQTDSWLCFTPGRRPIVILYQPQDYWHDTPHFDDFWLEFCDVHLIDCPKQALSHLPNDPARCAIIGDPRCALDSFMPNNPPSILSYLDYHRAYKTAYELTLMRLAQQRAVRGHQAALTAFRAGQSEFAIHMAYCAAVGQDANQLPYANIVALNQHGAVLHYDRQQQQVSLPVRSLVIDAGASERGYAADITRTYASDQASDFQALINAVTLVQQRLSHGVRNGVDFKQLHLQAHLELMRVAQDAGCIRVSPETAVATGMSTVFFPHGLGHLIGLQVHDVAGLFAQDWGGHIPRPEGHPYLRLTRTLEPTMVVTIEPGFYFIPQLLDQFKTTPQAQGIDYQRVEYFRPYGGIRIEDTVCCTTDQPENLTCQAFAQVS